MNDELNDYWARSVGVIRLFPCCCRIKMRQDSVSSWSQWITIPSPGYLEAEGQGPVHIREVEWIDLDPVEKQHRGALVRDQFVDHTNPLLATLAKTLLRFELKPDGIRIYPPESEILFTKAEVI